MEKKTRYNSYGLVARSDMRGPLQHALQSAYLPIEQALCIQGNHFLVN